MNPVLDDLRLELLPSVRHLDRPASRSSVSGVLSQLERFVCGWTGHDELMRFEPDRLSLHCSRCGHQSAGWEVRSPQVAVVAKPASYLEDSHVLRQRELGSSVDSSQPPGSPDARDNHQQGHFEGTGSIMNIVTLRPKPDRRRMLRAPTGPDRFGLQKVTDCSRGERFTVSIEGAGRFPESSKPMTESDSRRVLHKMGQAAGAIESMVVRAKAGDMDHQTPANGLGQLSRNLPTSDR